MHARSKIRIVAVLTVRNEALYLERCLKHLHDEGIETCIIDNESTDATLEIARKNLGRGVFRIETQPFGGVSELAARLRFKEQLCREIDADWFIHHDVDEIREAPAPFQSLYDGIMKVDRDGYNTVNFDEFVFLPLSDDETFEGRDYVEAMRHYCFFEPGCLRRVNAWKNEGQTVDLVSSGGHSVNFPGRNIYPHHFILRHYIVLSRAHAIAKYAGEGKYSREEVEQRGWHRARVNVNIETMRFPSSGDLHQIEDGRWNKSRPWKHHPLFGVAMPVGCDSPHSGTNMNCK